MLVAITLHVRDSNIKSNKLWAVKFISNCPISYIRITTQTVAKQLETTSIYTRTLVLDMCHIFQVFLLFSHVKKLCVILFLEYYVANWRIYYWQVNSSNNNNNNNSITCYGPKWTFQRTVTKSIRIQTQT